jgi:class 3 adenylate cyclase/predicted ATPase
MKCPKCQYENTDDSKFCIECGNQMEFHCPNCGAITPAKGKFCKECGYKLRKPKEAPPKDDSAPLRAMLTAAASDIPATALTAEVCTPDAERRQLTVMFCDLVGSTDLSAQLDPEDLREIVRSYQETAADVIQDFDGHIAQYLGDGLLVYFGYPQAHEDDAHRAVSAALEIVDAMGTLNNRLKSEHGVRLAVRLGIHTGPVVVGEMGGGGRHERLALGETPNIAARLEDHAEPDTVVISAMTKRLVESAFVLKDLGSQRLKGVPKAIGVTQVLSPFVTRSDEEEAGKGVVTALVGRDEEIGLLLRRWEQSKEGFGQVVLINGEPGIGKSALADVLREHVASEGYTRATYRCSPYHTNSALYPVITHLQRLWRWEREDTPAEKLDKMEDRLRTTSLPLKEVVPLFAALLSLALPEGRYPPLGLTAKQEKQQTQDAPVAWLLEEAERQPMLVVYEDLHWADPSTLEIIGLLVDQVPTAPLLTVLIFRPEFVPPWPSRSHMTPLTLNRLERPQVEAMITKLGRGKALPAEVLQHIVTRTDGVPLYVEELTKMLLESDLLQEEADHYVLAGDLSGVAIPATLQDSLMARLDRLPTVREVAQLGAVLGREFAYEMLRALAGVEESTLRQRLGQLVGAELLYQRGRPPRARYMFKHALIQDAAYASLLKRTRQQYHHQIAQMLEAEFSETVEAEPELVAHHYTEAGLNEQAVGYWYQAGRRATERSAYKEAISHLTTGLTLPRTLPESLARHQRELQLQTTLGAATLMVRGHASPEVEAAYRRAHVLCQQLGGTQDMLPVLFGLWRFFVMRADYAMARQLGEDLLGLAERSDDLPAHVIPHYAVGFTCFCLGELLPASSHLEEGIAHYIQAQRSFTVFKAGQDPGVACRLYAALTLWAMSYPDQALARAHDSLRLAIELGHPFSHAFAQAGLSMVEQLRRDAQNVYDHAEATVTLSTEQGFPTWLAMGKCLRGWALTALRQREEGMIELRQGLTDWRAIGTELFVPYFMTVLADGCSAFKRVDEALAALTEGWEAIERTGEYWWKAEVHRLKGDLLLDQSTSDVAQAADYFRQALDVARTQQAKSLELRAATSLARLWQSQDRRQEAYELLVPLHDWFTEGFDTADLKVAKLLLERLA